MADLGIPCGQMGHKLITNHVAKKWNKVLDIEAANAERRSSRAMYGHIRGNGGANVFNGIEKATNGRIRSGTFRGPSIKIGLGQVSQPNDFLRMTVQASPKG